MKEREEARLKTLKEYENKLHEAGVNYIAGIDEAGRGPLAGPVVVGVVIMKPDSFIEGINDSKKISETKREKLYEQITEEALAWSTRNCCRKRDRWNKHIKCYKKSANTGIRKFKNKAR